MPMIDVYAASGTFPDTRRLATDLATAVMTIEAVPDIPMFRQNTPRPSTNSATSASPTSTETAAMSASRYSPVRHRRRRRYPGRPDLGATH